MRALPLALAVLLALASPARAQTTSAAGAYQLYASVLSRYVKDGTVQYARLKIENPPEWRRFLDWLAEAEPESMTVEQRRAFWINAYNARVIAGVLDRYPIDSVRDVGFLGGRLRGFFGRREHPVAGRTRTLDEIEKEILHRPPLWDPRIHFALGCGSRSCPKLRAEPYDSPRLDMQLDFQTRTFLNGPDGHRLDPDRHVLYVSRILEWYRDDFAAVAGSLRGYLTRYLTGDAAAAAEDPAWSLEFMEYDWKLNQA